MLSWADILWSRKCTACGWEFRAAEFGLNRAFCPKCTATLPDPVALHLDRATHNRWFLAWWQIACRLLRERTPESMKAYQRLWNSGQAAVRKTEQNHKSPRSRIREVKGSASAKI